MIYQVTGFFISVSVAAVIGLAWGYMLGLQSRPASLHHRRHHDARPARAPRVPTGRTYMRPRAFAARYFDEVTDDARAALVNLGYKDAEVCKVLAGMSGGGDFDHLFKSAIAQLGANPKGVA